MDNGLVSERTFFKAFTFIDECDRQRARAVHEELVKFGSASPTSLEVIRCLYEDIDHADEKRRLKIYFRGRQLRRDDKPERIGNIYGSAFYGQSEGDHAICLRAAEGDNPHSLARMIYHLYGHNYLHYRDSGLHVRFLAGGEHGAYWRQVRPRLRCLTP